MSDEKKIKKVVAFEVDSDAANFPGALPIDHFALWVEQLRQEVPPEFRSRACVQIETDCEYEYCERTTISVVYYREETDEEVQERLEKARKQERDRKIKMMEEYKRLGEQLGM